MEGRIPELWDAVTGEIRDASQWRIHHNRTLLGLRLEAGGSIFVVLRKPANGMASANNGLNGDNPVTVQTLSPTWTIRFDTASGGPAQPVTGTLANWSLSADTAIRYYSGTAVYTQSFDWDGRSARTWLDLGRVSDIAQVSVNGVDCGVAWTAPWRVDITKALRKGNNKVSIEVSNTWANRLQGDRRLAVSQRITWTTAPYRLEGRPLPPSGLMGPVCIKQ